MTTSFAILLALVALAAGGLIGWLLGSRGGEQAKATAEALRLQLDGVLEERDCVRVGHGALSAELARLKADRAQFRPAHGRSRSKSKDALIAQFREIGDQLLEKAHKDFLDKAGERFTEADKASETKLKELLAPVETTLKRYEEGLQRVEKERIDQYAGLQARWSSRFAKGRGGCATKPATSSTRCAHRPRRAAAGASRASRTCSSRRA